MTAVISWSAAIPLWLEAGRLKGHRPQTLYTRRQHMERASRRLSAGPWAVTAEELLVYFHGQGWAPETMRAHRASLRSFYAWGVDAGHLAGPSPALLLPSVKPTDPNPRPVPDRVYGLALGEADERERLIIRLAAQHGLRRGEIALVHSRDLVEDLTGWSLLVNGKGGKLRTVPLLDDVARDLQRLDQGWAFPGRVEGHISPRWVGKLINRLLVDDWTIHKLRHRAATKWWDASEHDVFQVAELLGHASVETTRRYVGMNRARLRSTVNRAA